MKKKSLEKTKKSTIYLKLIYALLFITVYIVSVYYLFPYNKVKNLLQVMLSDASEMDVVISEMRFGLFDGIKFSNVTFKKKIKDTDTPVLSISKLNVMPEISSILSDTFIIKVDSKLYGGEVSGRLRIKRKPNIAIKSVDFDIKNLQIAQNPILNSLYNLRTSGTINGSVALDDLSQDITRSSGALNLKISSGEVKGIVINYNGSGFLRFDNMSLPDITFSSLQILLKKEQKIVKVEKAQISGNDINASVAGHLNLSQKLNMSSADLDVQFNISDEYVSKNETLSAIYDGSISRIKLEGLLSSPKFTTQ